MLGLPSFVGSELTGKIRCEGSPVGLLKPLSQPDFPEREGLECGSLTGVIRTNENYGLAKFDLDIVETLEVLDAQAGQHSR